ncbi:MAG: hypothetical protein ABI690_07725 [Chloroflexota bacterium]
MKGGKAGERRRLGASGGREAREAPPCWRKIGGNAGAICRCAKVAKIRIGGAGVREVVAGDATGG